MVIKQSKSSIIDKFNTSNKIGYESYSYSLMPYQAVTI